DLATVMDEEVGRVTQGVSQIMRTGLAKDSKEAFDILTRGAQLGGDKAQDLLDTFEEYGVQFKNMGLGGKQAMGIIVQGLQAGARNADLVADTIKEFSIEAVAGGERVSKGFKSLGLDAGSMSKQFGKGGSSAAKALDVVFDRLRAIEDPVKRNRVAIELFGTKAEDMGKALFAIDPSKAVEGLGDLEGATDRAGKALGETAKARATAFKRTLETNVVNFIGGTVLPALDKMREQLSGASIKPAAKTAAHRQPSMSPESAETTRALTGLEKAGIKVRAMWRDLSNYMNRSVIPALRQVGRWVQDELIPAYQKFYGTVLRAVMSAFRNVKKTVDENKESLDSLGKFLGVVATFIARHVIPIVAAFYGRYIKNMGAALSALIKVTANCWKAMRTFGSVVGTMASFITRVFLAMVSGLIKGAAKAFGWVPGLGGKLKAAAKAVEGFKDRTNAAIDKIRKGKRVNVDVYAKGHWRTGPRAIPNGPAHLQPYAKGGPVPAIGPESSRARDSVPALLRVDEHVWTPEEVDGVGGHARMLRLRAMARRGLLQGFATGGPVGVSVNANTASTKRVNENVWVPYNNVMLAAVSKVADEMTKIWRTFGGANGVVRAARSMIGYPYSWGGGGKGGPSYGIGRGSGTFGFDCSGLTEYAWWKGARKSIGGTTYSQWPNSRPTGRRPGALGFPHMGHVVIASDKPGYIIQAPFTGSHVQEVRSGRGYSWRWPKAAGYYAGGPVRSAGGRYVSGFGMTRERAGIRGVGIAGDPRRRMEHRGAGGPVRSHVPYVVGEYGAEVVIPRQPGQVVPAGARVVTQHITAVIQVPPTVDKAAVGREVAEVLYEYRRRGGKIPT
ncbi:MAG TPA: phage tail tape measure protein, partial [Gemmatimonadales bacterium]